MSFPLTRLAKKRSVGKVEDQLPKRPRGGHSNEYNINAVLPSRHPGIMDLIPFEIWMIIFLWAGTSLDELAFEFFRRRSADKIVGRQSQIRFLRHNLLDQTYHLALINLLIHWWKIPRNIFDNLIVWSTQCNQVQCLRMLMRFWDLHVCCKTSTCDHFIPHACYRPGMCNYPMVKAMSCPSIPLACIRFFIGEYGFQIDDRAYWLRRLLTASYFPFISALYAEYPTIGKRHLSILSRPDIFLVSIGCNWEIRAYGAGGLVDLLHKFLIFGNRDDKELHFTNVVNWLKTIGLNARRREHVM